MTAYAHEQQTKDQQTNPEYFTLTDGLLPCFPCHLLDIHQAENPERLALAEGPVDDPVGDPEVALEEEKEGQTEDLCCQVPHA